MKWILLISILFGIQTLSVAQERSYGYATIGSSAATIPHTSQLTANALLTGGVVWKIWDISINYEFVQLTPDYHSYYAQVQVLPLEVGKFEFLAGVKYGRIIRANGGDLDHRGTFNYFGANAETRFNPWKNRKWFISLLGNYDRRGDILYIWGDNSNYWKWTTHVKIGRKF